MKISFDLHGVLDDMPETMKFIMESVIKNGGEVHIITGSTEEKARKELKELGFNRYIHFTNVVGLPDYLLGKGKKVISYHPFLNNPEFSDLDWDSAKAQYCSENNINLHFDDTLRYGDYFKTPFARLWTKDK